MIVTLVLAGIAALLAADVALARIGWLRLKTRRKVVVHLTDSNTVEGLLRRSAPDGLVLEAAQYHDTERPVPLSGDVFLPRDRVSFVQVLR